MGLLERFLEGHEWSEDVAETLRTKEEAIRQISIMTAKIEALEDQIIEASFLMERQPDPAEDMLLIDMIGRLRVNQRFYRDRIVLMQKCIKTLEEYVTILRPEVN